MTDMIYRPSVDEIRNIFRQYFIDVTQKIEHQIPSRFRTIARRSIAHQDLVTIMKRLNTPHFNISAKINEASVHLMAEIIDVVDRLIKDHL